jgi:hypothetical protein
VLHVKYNARRRQVGQTDPGRRFLV